MSGYVVNTVYQDLRIKQGTTWAQSWQLLDQTTGLPVPAGTITGTLKFRTAPLGAGANAGAVVATVAFSVTAISGIFTATQTSTQTLAFPVGTLYYDGNITDSATGATDVLCSGQAVVEPTVNQ